MLSVHFKKEGTCVLCNKRWDDEPKSAKALKGVLMYCSGVETDVSLASLFSVLFLVPSFFFSSRHHDRGKKYVTRSKPVTGQTFFLSFSLSMFLALTSLLQTCCSVLPHVAEFVHGWCLKKLNVDSSPFNVSTYDYQKDGTFCRVCESIKQQHEALSAMGPDDEMAEENLSVSERGGRQPATAANSPAVSAGQQRRMKSKSGMAVVPQKVCFLLAVFWNIIMLLTLSFAFAALEILPV